MHCPRCEVEVLEERTRDGVTIDSCPSCRGVWLDRGELERLIARALPAREERDEEPARASGRLDRGRDEPLPRDRRDERRRDDDDDDDDGPRRGGFFSTLRNIFD
jgi:Zn-finger nucleic acid-binding protein